MIYDPAREKSTIASSGIRDRPKNPVQVLRDATDLYKSIEGHNPQVLGVMEERLESFGSMERTGISIARLYYDALVSVGALEMGAHKRYPTLIDTIAAAKHPTPIYHWCNGQYDQYSFEVNDSNPRGLDLSRKDEYLAAGRDKLLRMKETERRGSVPDQEDIDFFSGLFADVTLRAQGEILENLAKTPEPAADLTAMLR